MNKKIDVKFSNRKPLRGIQKRPIFPSKEVKEMDVAYTQATKIAKASDDAAVKDENGEYIPYSSNMAKVLPATAKAYIEAKESIKEEPTFDPINTIFFANGTPITITNTESGSGALIKWLTGEQEVPMSAIIYGGAKEKDVESTSITIEGGNLMGSQTTLYGAGYKGGVTGYVSIKIKDGAVKTITGGGALNCTVNKVALEMTGGTVGAITCAGAAFIDNPRESVGDENAPEDSPNRTNEVVAIITGGTIYDSSNGFGLLYGGGQGFSYTGKVDITVGGDANLSKECYVTGAGSNGYTGDVKMTVKDSVNIKYLQTGNRGKVNSAIVNMVGGTVDKFYAGGEDASSVTPSYVSETMPAINVTLTSGTINALHPGKNGTTVITADSEIVKVAYSSNITITNIEDAKSLFGTSLVELV